VHLINEKGENKANFGTVSLSSPAYIAGHGTTERSSQLVGIERHSVWAVHEIKLRAALLR
jgi:hypothetical protein